MVMLKEWKGWVGGVVHVARVKVTGVTFITIREEIPIIVIVVRVQIFL